MKALKQVIMGFVFPEKQLVICGALLIGAVTGAVFANHFISGSDIEVNRSWFNAVVFGVAAYWMFVTLIFVVKEAVKQAFKKPQVDTNVSQGQT